MSKFTIVEFVDERTVECIPSSWVCNSKCDAYWPGYVSQEKLKKAIRNE